MDRYNSSNRRSFLAFAEGLEVPNRIFCGFLFLQSRPHTCTQMSISKVQARTVFFLSERSYRSSCSEFSSVLSKTSFSVVAFSSIFHCIQFSGVQDTNQSIRFRIDLSNAQNVTSMPSQPHALTELLLLS